MYWIDETLVDVLYARISQKLCLPISYSIRMSIPENRLRHPYYEIRDGYVFVTTEWFVKLATIMLRYYKWQPRKAATALSFALPQVAWYMCTEGSCACGKCDILVNPHTWIHDSWQVFGMNTNKPKAYKPRVELKQHVKKIMH